MGILAEVRRFVFFFSNSGGYRSILLKVFVFLLYFCHSLLVCLFDMKFVLGIGWYHSHSNRAVMKLKFHVCVLFENTFFSVSEWCWKPSEQLLSESVTLGLSKKEATRPKNIYFSSKRIQRETVLRKACQQTMIIFFFFPCPFLNSL